MSEISFHWKHLKERNWIQESLDRCIVLFCFLYSRLNGNFERYDYSMEESLYKSFFNDLIENDKINQSLLWNEPECKNLLEIFIKGENKEKFDNKKRDFFFERLSQYVRFHMKGARKNALLYPILITIFSILTGIAAFLSIRSKLYWNFIYETVMFLFCSGISVFLFVRYFVLIRKVKKLNLKAYFTEIDYEFCFEKLSEEIEYVNKTYRFVYDVLDELVLRRQMLVKNEGHYKLNTGRKLPEFLKFISEYYYDAEHLFTPKFIEINIRNEDDEIIKAKTVTEARSRIRGEEKDRTVY